MAWDGVSSGPFFSADTQHLTLCLSLMSKIPWARAGPPDRVTDYRILQDGFSVPWSVKPAGWVRGSHIVC